MDKFFNSFLFFIALLLLPFSYQRSILGKFDNLKNVDDSYGKFIGAGDVVGKLRDPSISHVVDIFQLRNSWKRNFGPNRLPTIIHIGRSFSKAGGTDGWYYGSGI